MAASNCAESLRCAHSKNDGESKSLFQLETNVGPLVLISCLAKLSALYYGLTISSVLPKAQMFSTQKSFHRLIALTCLGLVSSSSAGSIAAQPQQTRAKTPAQIPIGLFVAYGYNDVVRSGQSQVPGVRLSYVKPGGLAATIGLRVNDVVFRINRNATPNAAVLNAILQNNRYVSKQIHYYRHNGTRYDDAIAYTSESDSTSAVGGAPPKRSSQAEMEDYMITIVNADRAQNGLSTPLRKSSSLGRMARAYADDMAKRNFHGHKDPEGRDPWTRAKMFGINSMNIQENCAYPFPEPNSLTMVKKGEAQLMNSPEHKVAIVQPDNVCIGVGIAYRGDGGLMIVQIFSPDNLP